MKKRSNLFFLLLCVALTIPSLIGLFHQGFFATDDGNWMVIRFSAFYEALRNGQFPVRFLFRLNNGFGYPVADFLYPLFMYIGVPIHILGFSFVNTIKIILGLSLVFSSIFSFLWLRKLFDNVSSLMGAFLYTYFPYHLWDVYKRGSVGEVLALSIVPFIFWQAERKNFLFTGLGIALLIMSHNSLAFIFLPFIFLYILIKNNNIKSFLKTFILGFGLSAFFWLPALYDKQFTVFDKTGVSDFSNYFISINNLNILGLIFFAVAAFSIILFTRNKDKLSGFFLISTLLLTVLIFPLSFPIWKYLPFVNFIQFPFRLISFIILGLSFLLSYQLNLFKGKLKIVMIIFYLILIIFSAKNFIFPKEYQNYPDSFYSTNQDSTTVKNEYMPKWVKVIPLTMPSEKVTVIKGQGIVQNLFANGNKVTFSINVLNETQVQFNTVYFPGWIVKVDGKEIPMSYNNDNGLIRFLINPGNHNVNIFFGETPLRMVSDLISLVSLIAFFVFIIKDRKLLFKI